MEDLQNTLITEEDLTTISDSAETTGETVCSSLKDKAIGFGVGVVATLGLRVLYAKVIKPGCKKVKTWFKDRKTKKVVDADVVEETK